MIALDILVTAEETARLIRAAEGRTLHLRFGHDGAALHPDCEWPLPLLAEWRHAGRPHADRPLTDPRDIDYGLYRVFWRSGGSSQAAIGGDASGNLWIAPTNWLAAAPLSAEIFANIAILQGPAEWIGEGA